MRSRKTLLILMATLLIGVTAAGCGGPEAGGDEAYEEVLRGLKKAALSSRAYNAVGRAEGLKPTLRASLDAFCETNREMLQNQEAWKATKTGYYVVRIKLRAERELPFISTAPVGAAVSKFRDLLGLDSFNPAVVRRYAKACYA